MVNCLLLLGYSERTYITRIVPLMQLWCRGPSSSAERKKISSLFHMLDPTLLEMIKLAKHITYTRPLDRII